MPQTRSYRNNNPGNIRAGSFANRHGATGSDAEGFAIWPTSAEGFAALVALLRTATYRALTIEAAINRYAPASENDSAAYVASVCGQTELSPDQVLGDLPPDELAGLAWAMAMHEGWDKD